jgi:hypothetical protein
VVAFENRPPGPLLIKDKKVKVTHQSQIAIRLPEPKPIVKKKLKLTTVCHHIAKPNVKCSHTSGFFFAARDHVS